MRIFLDHKAEWAIGITCTFLPAAIAKFIETTSSIPDIKIPFWILCLIIAAPLGYVAAQQYGKRIKTITNKTYGVEKVNICGKHFVNCKFDGTELEFDASAPTSMGHCTLTAQRLKFSGSAELTFNYFVSLYSDPSFRPIIEATFEDIKNKGLEIEHSRAAKS